ncbi:MAG: hydrogenase small subunit [Dehalococcoidia bacterium]
MTSLAPAQTIDLSVELERRGVSRRSFLKFCATMAGVLALPPRYAHLIAASLQSSSRVPVIWLNGQDCAGNTEALLRANKPTVAEVILDTLSLDYQEVLMAAAGKQAEEARAATMAAFPNGYIAVVEGSIPLADGGVYCTIGGRAFAEIVREVCAGALGVIAVGSCAFDGGIPAARGGITGAVGVSAFVKDKKIINLSGCPMNPENLTATIVQYLTLKEFPATDELGRPLFAYGDTVHEHCESLAHYRRKELVQEWGDEGHRAGWCLYQMGCKGPATVANCSTVRFNAGTSWPVASGHGCVGCTTPRFWDTMVPFYEEGGPKAVATPTAVAYQTPVPGSSPSPSDSGDGGVDGGDSGGGGGFGGAEVAGVAVGAATLVGLGGFLYARKRQGDAPGPGEGGEHDADRD